jgi:predicted XRE-type DNA-binding protein
MTEELESIRGSGNVFRDLGLPNADVEQAKAILAAEIVGVLEDRQLSTRKAQALTDVDHSEFARIRGARLDRFTIDRLVIILNLLGQQVDVGVSVRPSPPINQQPNAAHP